MIRERTRVNIYIGGFMLVTLLATIGMALDNIHIKIIASVGLMSLVYGFFWMWGIIK